MRHASPPCYHHCSHLIKWLAMEKLARSQVAKGLFLLILLLFIPFISSSLRTSYLYFLLNILIVALGVEAGFLDAISRPHEEKKAQNTTATPIAVDDVLGNATNEVAKVANPHERIPHAPKPVQKMVKVVPRAQTVKRCPSRPSLFFIGGGSEGESVVVREEEVKEEEEEEREEAGELSKQELFAKAEAFIGNFYMQLKMQREESWKKIHGLYHRAF